MPKFKISAKALDDFKSIGRYTSRKWGKLQRNKYLGMIDDSFQAISHQPNIGMACNYIKPGYRKYHAGRHLIFYRQKSDHIEIIRILHDSMDIIRHL
jgi:toxin ParE1/3/4